MGIRIKESPSGKEIVGTANGQILVWNDTTKRWDVGAAPGGGSTPLPRTYWVSPLSVSATEDGSSTNPFKTPQAAIDALELEGVGGVLLMAAGQGAYNALSATITSVDIAMVGYGNFGSNSADRPFLAGIHIAGGVRATFENLGCIDFEVVPGTGPTVRIFDCVFLGARFSECSVTAENYSGPFATHNLGVASTVTLVATNCTIGFVGAAGLPYASATLIDSDVSGGMLSDAVTLIDSRVVANPSITCNTLVAQGSRLGTGTSAATVNAVVSAELDSFTLSYMRTTNGILTTAALSITDRPLTTGLVFAVPALAAAFADVTGAVTGCRPGDTFDVTTTARLADVGIVDAFCDVNDVLTLRFFGTNAGGNVTVNVNVNPNS